MNEKPAFAKATPGEARTEAKPSSPKANEKQAISTRIPRNV